MHVNERRYIDAFNRQCANVNLIFLLRAVADPEGSLLGKGGGVTKSAQSAALERVREWIPLLQVGARELPRNIFENWMQMVHSEPYFCVQNSC